MASSKLMASTTTATNSDLPPHQSSICSLTIADLHSDQSKNYGSMSMEDLLKNIYSDSLSPDAFPSSAVAAALNGGAGDSGNGGGGGGGLTTVSRQGSFSLPKNVVNKTVDEVWKEIVSGGSGSGSGSDRMRGGVGEGGGGGGGGGMMEEMTLEDFLTKAGAVREDEVGVPVMAGLGGYGVDTSSIMNGGDGGGAQFQHQMQAQSVVDGSIMGFGNGIDGRVLVNGGGGGGGGGGRGGRNKRRAVEETVDKATQQKQRRMIKNRESAARSRERKQAYAVELESLVTQLEEENARLRREEAEESKERFKQLMENLIPVVEKRKEPRVLRRVQSMQW